MKEKEICGIPVADHPCQRPADTLMCGSLICREHASQLAKWQKLMEKGNRYAH